MKKRFFNTAVAIAAAMALSVSAFAEAAEPGLSVPGFSGIPGASTALVKGEIVGSTMKLGSSEGIAVDGRLKYFGDRTNVVLCASLQDDVPADVQEATEAIVTDYLSAQKPTMSSNTIEVNMVIRVQLYDLDAEEYFEPSGPLTVSVPTDSVSNIVAFISEDGKTIEWRSLNKGGNTVMSFTASHFSDYYFMTLDEDVVEALTTNDPGNDVPAPGETTTAPTTPVGPGGSDNTTTTTTAAPDATTAPDSTTAPGTNNGGDTTTAPSENTDNNGSNGGDTTNAPADGGNDSTDDNNNTGNTDGTGNDKNQNTGVVLAVIPAAIAAAAVVISKKRK